jgi:hypothetical protein
MMKRIFTALIISVFCVSFALPQTIIQRDPGIAAMVKEISADRLEQHVRKLVSFETRHNMSEQNSRDKGIGASWNWIKAEFESYIPASGGRLSVAFEDYKT